MQSKYVIPGILAVVLIAAVGYFATHRQPATKPTAKVTNTQQQNYGIAQGQTTPAASTPINTNVGSVAGVDLSEFAAEANQSASLSAQDGTNDAQVVSSDGQDVNSSINSVNNPIK